MKRKTKNTKPSKIVPRREQQKTRRASNGNSDNTGNGISANSGVLLHTGIAPPETGRPDSVRKYKTVLAGLKVADGDNAQSIFIPANSDRKLPSVNVKALGEALDMSFIKRPDTFEGQRGVRVWRTE